MSDAPQTGSEGSSVADLVNKGCLLAAQGQAQAALQAFEAALHLDPSCSQARYNTG